GRFPRLLHWACHRVSVQFLRAVSRIPAAIAPGARCGARLSLRSSGRGNVRRRRRDDEYGTMRVTERVLGNTAERPTLEALVTVTTNHDQVGLSLFSEFQNLRARIAGYDKPFQVDIASLRLFMTNELDHRFCRGVSDHVE